jgi:hypothetical protein
VVSGPARRSISRWLRDGIFTANRYRLALCPSVKFDDDLVGSQELEFPQPKPVKFELLGETLPVYQREFRATGYILLKQKLPAGQQKLTGTLNFQECNDKTCKLPQSVRPSTDKDRSLRSGRDAEVKFLQPRRRECMVRDRFSTPCCCCVLTKSRRRDHFATLI